MSNRVVVVDYGSQYAFLIATRLRSPEGGGVMTEVILPKDLATVTHENVSGVVFSGGPRSATSISEHERRIIYDPRISVLGICYGHQLIGLALGGTVRAAEAGEFGPASIRVIDRSDKLFVGCCDNGDHGTLDVWMSHNDEVAMTEKLAENGTVVTAVSKNVSFNERMVASIRNERYSCYGVQFHPEVTHSQQGSRVLRNFVTRVCGLREGTWTNLAKLDKCFSTIHEIVGENDRVVLGLSGGVDSAVVAALLAKTLKPHQWLAVYVDHGLMRAGETDAIKQYAAEQNLPFVCLDYSEQFFSALRGVVDPEKKRAIIGKLFIEAFQSAAEQFTPTILAQGTIYPDVVESAQATNANAANASGGATQHLIKSHHNVGGLPAALKLRLLEPLRWLFKGEVRELGRQLGLPNSIVSRPPFPGPGIAIRVLGEVTREKVATVQRADKIFHDAVRDAVSDTTSPSQFYAALLEGKAVGVVGDQRRYGSIIGLRAVQTDDFMTATITAFDWKMLQSLAARIVNECPDVARVFYDITPKPPGTIELE